MNPEDQMRKMLGTPDSSELASETEWQEFRARAHRSVAIRRTLVAGGAAIVLALGVAGAATLANRDNPIRDPRPVPPAGTPDRIPEPEPTATQTMVIEPSFPYPSSDADPSSVVQVWFVGEKTERLSPTFRLVDDPVAIGNRAVAALLAGPSGPDVEAGDTSLIPEGTRLLGLTIDDGVATVDLSQEFQTTGLGSGFEHFPLAQVVWTLTQFRTVDSVVIEVEGERIDSYGSHGIATDKPLKRKHYEEWAPPIVVDSPFPGQIVDSTFTLEGNANVFEANVSYRIRSNGDILAEGFSTATCGTGCRGDFAEVIDVFVERRTSAMLEVFESSAEDGSPLHMVQVPITIDP